MRLKILARIGLAMARDLYGRDSRGSYFSQDLSFKENVTARGISGIGIYAKGTLEAVYTGGSLSIGQLTQMTSGDGSAAAMNNQMWSYWGSNTVPSLQA